MKNTQGVSRRDFLKRFPRYLVESAQSVTSDELPKPLEPGGMKVAKLNRERCLAWEGVSCQHCYLVCPLRETAIRLEDQKPVIISPLCNGCAECVVACQTVNDPPALEMILNPM